MREVRCGNVDVKFSESSGTYSLNFPT